MDECEQPAPCVCDDGNERAEVGSSSSDDDMSGSEPSPSELAELSDDDSSKALFL